MCLHSSILSYECEFPFIFVNSISLFKCVIKYLLDESEKEHSYTRLMALVAQVPVEKEETSRVLVCQVLQY